MKTKIGKMLNVFFCFLVLIGAAIFSASVSLKQDVALAADSTDDEPTLRVLNSDEQKLCSDDEKTKEYYIIYNANQMRWFRDKVNGGDTAINCFVKEDLDMTEGSTSTTTEEINGESVTCANWDPIGGIWGKDYSGIFNGGNKIVSNWAVQDKTYSGGINMGGILCIGTLGTTKVKNCYYNCAGSSSIPAVVTSHKNATVETEKVESKTEADFSNWVVRDLLDQGRNVWAQGTTYPIFVDAAEGEITLSWDKLNYKYNFGKWDVSARKYDNETGWVTPFPKLTAKSSSTNAKFRIYVTFTPNEDSMSPVDKKYFGIFDVDKLTGSPLDYIELAAAKNGSVQSKIVALKLLGILNGSAGKAFKQDSSNNRLGVFNIKVTY